MSDDKLVQNLFARAIHECGHLVALVHFYGLNPDNTLSTGTAGLNPPHALRDRAPTSADANPARGRRLRAMSADRRGCSRAALGVSKRAPLSRPPVRLREISRPSTSPTRGARGPAPR